MKTLMMQDIEEYVSNSEYLIECDLEREDFTVDKINYDGWRDLYLDYLCIYDTTLLERFGTEDKELIYDTLNSNIRMFNEIVKKVYNNKIINR